MTEESRCVTHRVGWVDYFWMYATSALVILTGVLVYRLATTHLGKDGFSEYAISRRAIALIVPAIILGLGVAIPRQISLHLARGSALATRSCFLASLVILVAVASLFSLGANLFSGGFAYLFFGTPEYKHLALPVTTLIFGQVLNAAAYGYFRGRLQMKRACLLLGVNAGLIPLVGFLGSAGGTSSVLFWTGFMTTCVSTVALIAVLISESVSTTLRDLRRAAGELLSYGLRRVPGDFALAALMGLPCMVAAHYLSLREAGMIAFGAALLALAGSAFSPISVILLPKSTRMLQGGEHEALRKEVLRLLWISVGLSVIGTAVGELVMEMVIKLYLGPDYTDAAGIARFVLLGALPYIVYVCLRSLLDAAYVSALNSRNAIAALFVLILSLALGLQFSEGATPILIAWLAALWALGILTLVEVLKVIRGMSPWVNESFGARGESTRTTTSECM